MELLVLNILKKSVDGGTEPLRKMWKSE